MFQTKLIQLGKMKFDNRRNLTERSSVSIQWRHYDKANMASSLFFANFFYGLLYCHWCLCR